YQVFDVAGQLRQDRNVLGAIIADGWYRGRLGMAPENRNVFGAHLALLAQLEIHYEDGSSEVVVSNADWRTTTGPILSSSLYDGERYDARLELLGWSEPGYDARDWRPVHIVDHPLSTLVAPTDPPIRRIEELPVASVLESPSGALIVDFGQNLVG